MALKNNTKMKTKKDELVRITPHRITDKQSKFLKNYAKKNKIKVAVALRLILDNFIQQHE